MSEIVVGVDESPSAAEALHWAVREHELRGGTLTAVLAYTYLEQHHAEPDDQFDPSYHSADAEAALERIVADNVPSHAATIVKRVVCDGASRALLEASVGADLLVVGARGLGGFRGMVLGSVSQQCAHHTAVPIAVVRAGQPAERIDEEHVVVGIDRSTNAEHALRWAVDEARLRRAHLTVVHAWRPAIFAAVDYAAPVLDRASLEAAAKDTIDQALAAVDTDGLSDEIEALTVQGGAADAILEVAAHASLVVVGSRGRGGFTGLLLGSVSQRVLNHAHRPVVIIPPADRVAAPH